MIQTSSMNPASMRTTILWLHAVGGVAWIGAAAVFVIAASAVGLEDDDGLAMVRRIAPIINRIGLARCCSSSPAAWSISTSRA